MARLPQGVRKRKDGSYEKRFTMNGVRYSVYASTTKELANKEQEMRETIKKGRYKKNKKITLNDYFEEWIERKTLANKGNSLKTYKSIYNNHLSKPLGKYKVHDLERRMITELQKDLAEKYPPTTVNYIISVLKIILNDAVRDEVIEKNVADIRNIKTESSKATKTKHRALTPQEQELFIRESETSYYYELFALALCTGMRCGEITALTWADIDYPNNCIHVNKTVTYDKDNSIAIGSPKTSSGVRDIPLTTNIKAVLQRQRAKSNLYDIDRENDRLYHSIRGRGYIICNETLNDEIKKIVKRLNNKGYDIKPFTFHAFRDTFATRYIEQGGNMHTLKKILGHAKLEMTMDIYAQVLPDTMQDEMNKIIIAI